MFLFSSSHDKASKPTRFSEKKGSKKIIELIEQLSTKEIKLKSSADSMGLESLDYAKYVILSRLLSDMRNSIDEFNNKPCSENDVTELQEYINLLRELAEFIRDNNKNREFRETLSKFRNNAREYAKTSFSLGVLGAVGAAFTLSGLAVGASALLLGSGMNCVVDGKTDVYSPLPKTYSMLIQLLKLLDLTIKNLVLTMNLAQLPYSKVKVSDEDNMICPITQQLMNDPSLCTLDGYSYETDELKKWLILKGTSPITRKPMEPGTALDKVMIPNRHLKQIIDNYKLYQYVAENQLSEEETKNRNGLTR